jgi:hypothetical protein
MNFYLRQTFCSKERTMLIFMRSERKENEITTDFILAIYFDVIF